MKRYNVQACATGDQPGAYLDVEEATDGEWVRYDEAVDAARQLADAALLENTTATMMLWRAAGSPSGSISLVGLVRQLVATLDDIRERGRDE